jgi:hypothetical protein
VATWTGVIPTVAASETVAAQLRSIGVKVRSLPEKGTHFFIALVRAFDGQPELDTLASRVVEVTGASAFTVLAQTGADVYAVGEVAPSGLVRRVTFSRDAEPCWTVEGAPRPWEADLRLWMPIDECMDRIGDRDDEWPPTRLDAVQRAYAERRVDLLPDDTPFTASHIAGFMKHLGAPLECPNHPEWKSPGLIARMFRRRD